MEEPNETVPFTEAVQQAAAARLAAWLAEVEADLKLINSEIQDLPDVTNGLAFMVAFRGSRKAAEGADKAILDAWKRAVLSAARSATDDMPAILAALAGLDTANAHDLWALELLSDPARWFHRKGIPLIEIRSVQMLIAAGFPEIGPAGAKVLVDSLRLRGLIPPEVPTQLFSPTANHCSPIGAKLVKLACPQPDPDPEPQPEFAGDTNREHYWSPQSVASRKNLQEHRRSAAAEGTTPTESSQ